MQKKNTGNGALPVHPSMVKVLDRMRRLCSRREYCISDIRAKAIAALAPELRTSGDMPEDMRLAVSRMADEIISSLISDRYVDDLRYATAFARDKSSLAGWGEAKIRYALSAKKIDRDVISAALEEIDDGKASARLEKLLETKYRSLCRSSSDRWELRNKLLRFAISRGYSCDEACPAIDRLVTS